MNNERKPVHVAVDIGYGYVKAISTNGERVVFPSLVGRGFDLDIYGSFGKANDDDIHIVYGKDEYFVGELAEKESRSVSRVFEQERFMHEYTKVLLNTAIQLVTKGKSDQVYVSTGLPLDFFNAQKDEFRQSIIGLQPLIKWKSGSLKGKQLKTNIKDAIVLPQGASAMFSALINSEGRFTYPHLMNEGNMMALIDVGFRTTDYVVVEIQKDSSFTPNVRLSGTLDVGVVNLHEEIKQYYKRETGGADLNESHLTRILANQQVTYRGRRISFKEMILESMNSIATNISDRLKATWVEEADLFDAIFIAGGGGKMLEPVLQPRFDNRLELIAENQFANAIGYLRLGNKVFSSRR